MPLPAVGDAAEKLLLIPQPGRWYVGALSAREAEERVLGLPPGAFVVRETRGSYYFCVSFNGSARQVPVCGAPGVRLASLVPVGSALWPAGDG